MLLECICRLCLTKYENQNELFVISCENNLDTALASIFNRKIEPEIRHLYKVCGPCGAKLMEFYDFYISALQNEDKLIDIALNEKLFVAENPIPSPNLTLQIPEEQILISNEIEIEDVEMSNDAIYESSSSAYETQNDSNSSYEEFKCDLSSTIDNNADVFDQKPLKLELLSLVASNEKVQPMEVELIKNQLEKRLKTRCNECGVYVVNIFQHKRCVHDFSAKQECVDCKAVFPNRLKLLMHKYYKHVPPRYKCEFCHKQVRTKSQLREHTYQKHYEGVYLYQCGHCEAQFNYRTSLVIHQKRLHPEEYEKAKQHRLAMKYRP